MSALVEAAAIWALRSFLVPFNCRGDRVALTQLAQRRVELVLEEVGLRGRLLCGGVGFFESSHDRGQLGLAVVRYLDYVALEGLSPTSASLSASAAEEAVA